MPSKWHEARVGALVTTDPRIERFGFSRALIGALADAACVTRADVVAGRGPRGSSFGVVPDAFRIDREAREAHVYEVEVTAPMTSEKLELYADMWFELDCEGWGLHLTSVDRLGTHVRVDLMVMWYEILALQTRQVAAVRP